MVVMLDDPAAAAAATDDDDDDGTDLRDIVVRARSSAGMRAVGMSLCARRGGVIISEANLIKGEEGAA